MFIKLFYTLRTYGVPVSTRELLDLNAALEQGLMMHRILIILTCVILPVGKICIG